MKRSLTALICASAGLASAASISSVTGTLGGGVGNSLAVVSWTQSDTFTNVNISAVFTTATNPAASGTFYLTRSLGPGTTAADEIARVQLVNIPATNNPQLEGLFGGLTLGPGTYYLSLAHDLGSPFLNWVYVNSNAAPVVSTANGVTQNAPQFAGLLDPAYSPASVVFGAAVDPIYAVTGDVVVPEPATVTLVGLAGAFLAAVAARRRRRA